MSRITKWKLEKTKVKVVFRLQFHATHIPQTGWNNLFISFIPSDSGKATAKTNKANVRNGTCKWADPIYETTRLLQDAKTKQFEEKLYKLVAMGTSRSSILGEANINLSDYVDALKPTVVALPLRGSDSGAILHVTVQLLTSKTGFREFEQQREVSDRGLQTNTEHDSVKLSKPGDAVISHTDKVNPRVRFKPGPKELPSLEEESGFSEEYPDSAAGFDGSSNTSESLYADKHDNSSAREVDSVKSTVSGDLGGTSPTQSPRTEKGASDHRFLVQGTSNWIHHFDTENSMDGEIAIVYEENSRLRGALEAADLSIHELRKELSSLQSHADDIGVEAQKLTEQLVTEISSEQDLVREVSLLKSECARFKNDLEWLRNLKLNPPIPRRKTIDTDQCNLLQDSNLRWLKGLSVVEDKISLVQNKVLLGLHGKDSAIIQSDLEAVLSSLQDLKRGTLSSVDQLDDLRAGKTNRNMGGRGSPKTDHIMSDTGLGVELCHPEGVLLPGLLAHGTGSMDATNAMQGEIFNFLRELDESKAERENLVRKMDQMECYYEALIQELEENQKQILGELQNIRNEHSSCIYTISSTKAQMEAMHQQMSDELLQLAEERCNLDTLNKELERRAISSEAALRRARLNYSIAVSQLQKDLEVLSLQVVSMYKTNENLIQRAFSEVSQPLLEGSQEALPSDLDAENSNSDKPRVCQNHNMGVKNQLPGSDRLLEDLKRSLTLQEDLYRKIQEELSEMHLANVHLDVFSLTLHQTLLEEAADSRHTKEEMREFAKQLELSSKSNELLNLKLQNILGDICALSEEKAIYVSRCDDLASKNQTLEANVKSVCEEKGILSEKIGELESLLTELRSYRSKYEDCNSEKAKLSNLLEQVDAEKVNLSNEISLLQEESRTMKAKTGELSSSKEHLQKIVGYMRERLEGFLASDDEQGDGLPSSNEAEDKNSEFGELTSVILLLEGRWRNFQGKILQLMKENGELRSERDTALLSLASAKSEVEVVKQKFQRDVPEMVMKLNASGALVEKLQTDLEGVGNRLKVSSEAEERYTWMTEDLLSDFAKMEAALEELSSKNRDLAGEITSLGSVSDEVEGKRLMIDKMTQENLSLVGLLQNKTNESDMLALVLKNLRGTLGNLQDELSYERSIRDQLEAEVLNLSTQLKEKDEKLPNLDQHKAELSVLKQQLADMESEKFCLYHQLSHLEEQLKMTNLENELLDAHFLLVASDAAYTAVVTQYKCHVEEFLHKLEYSKKHVEEVLSSKESCTEENARLLSALKCLRTEAESYVSLNKALEHSNSVMTAEIEEGKKRNDFLESKNVEIEERKCFLKSFQKEIDDLILTKEELEIRFLVLKENVDEKNAERHLDEKNREEVTVTLLRRQCSELSRKLSEQTLKTEEFKNLSIHLKELKDKVDAEHVQALEKKEPEGSSVAMQESLRIAFIKEQYETKLQEVRHQLSVSKKHGEEMLWKLQDALNELEDRRKCEASELKRNEELLLKIAELEAELQSVLSDNRERFMAYDQLKAELDCSMMSLDCCREEKKQLTSSLQECNDEKSRLADEAELMREQLENLKAFMRSPEEKYDWSHVAQRSLNATARGENLVENSHPSTLCSGRETLDASALSNTASDQAKYLASIMIVKAETEDVNVAPLVEGDLSRQPVQGASLSEGPEETSGLSNGQNDFVHQDQLKAQNLMSSMDRLQKELERMRNENMLLPEDENQVEPDQDGLHREQVNLEKVTKELGNISSLYNDSSRSGNSIERVLALELELAEALQAKKKSSIQFQSSFLKLHNDEAAIFQSFRDINELIKDMLEMKGRYGAMEAELKEMLKRYSQLSLQFAGVEGERQKLMIMLRNVRSPKRLSSPPPSFIHEESSS